MTPISTPSSHAGTASPTSSAQAGRGASAGRDGAERTSRLPPDDTREAFERAMTSRRQPTRDETGDQSGNQDEPAEPPGCWPSGVVALAPRPTAVPAGASPGAVDGPATGTRAALDAALQAGTTTPVSPVAGVVPAAQWEVFIGGGLQGLPLELRAERSSTQGQPAAWALTIGTAAPHADALSRQAPRLTERLRKQGVDVEHVRIESSERDPGQGRR